MANTSSRVPAKSASRSAAPAASMPEAASSTVGLNASGGMLSWASQLVRHSVRNRPGWVAAKTWATAPPVSLATRSTVPRSAAAQMASTAAASVATSRGRSAGAGVWPWRGRSMATQRRCGRRASMTWRHSRALVPTPWTNSVVGPSPTSRKLTGPTAVSMVRRWVSSSSMSSSLVGIERSFH